jgi:predicted Zn finger-like uncharacterized protein
MRIVCPSCDAAYDVSDTLVARRRTVRCARCGVEWINEPPPQQPHPDAPAQKAPDPETPPPEAPAPEALAPEAVVRPAAQPQPPAWPLSVTPEARAEQRVIQPPSKPAAAEGNGTVWLAWIASLALLVAVGFAAWQYRADVMHLWPASERVYQTLGLTEQ